MRKRRRGTGPLSSQQRDVPVEPRDWRGARVGRSRGSPALFVEGLELFEAKLERQRLGLGRCKWWGAGRKTQAVQDGANGLGRLDHREQAHSISTARTHEGVDGEHALEKLGPREPSRARDACAVKSGGGGPVGFAARSCVSLLLHMACSGERVAGGAEGIAGAGVLPRRSRAHLGRFSSRRARRVGKDRRRATRDDVVAPARAGSEDAVVPDEVETWGRDARGEPFEQSHRLEHDVCGAI